MAGLRAGRLLFRWGATLGVLAALLTSMIAVSLVAQSASDFSLQVTPSPLVATVKPGQTANLELRVRNTGTGTEELKIDPRKFTIDKKTGEVNLQDTTPPEVASWISFSSPIMKVKPGEWATQQVRIAVPKEAGFSYYFTLVISRANNPKPIESGRLIKGSLAVFTLINVDRPGAVKKLEVNNFSVSQSVYEYLPAEFSVTFNNTGNSIVQPYGNVFVQRSSNDQQPIATLPVNSQGGYLLPEVTRTMVAQWDKGFPVFQSTTSTEGKEKSDLVWDWSKLTDFRIGMYTAKLVAIYNDGQRDVPVEREVTFWVIPWRTILILLAILGVIAYARHKQIQRKTRRAVQKALRDRDAKQGNSNDK